MQVAGLEIVNSASCWSAFETAEVFWSLEVFLLGRRPIVQYYHGLTLLNKKLLDIYRLVLHTEPLYLFTNLASTSPAKSSTGTKPSLCITGSGGPPLKSSYFQIGGLQLKLVVPSKSSRPTKAPSCSPQSDAPQRKRSWENGLGTGILDPETKSQSEMTTKSVPIYRIHTVKYGCSLG
jgi:hypothetical protein